LVIEIETMELSLGYAGCPHRTAKLLFSQSRVFGPVYTSCAERIGCPGRSTVRHDQNKRSIHQREMPAYTNRFIVWVRSDNGDFARFRLQERG
jgi:hypothetical protein